VQSSKHGNGWTHLTAAVVVPGCLALCVWQVLRALGGNGLSWAYVFEWPIFAGYGVYMWWKLTHDRTAAAPLAPADTAPAESATDGSVTATESLDAAISRHAAEAHEDEDEELASYNRYLAALNASGRRKHW
jgi:hypothetical protein